MRSNEQGDHEVANDRDSVEQSRDQDTGTMEFAPGTDRYVQITAGSAHASALPDDYIDRFAVAGPSEHCISRLAELIEAGAERLVLVPGSRDADRGELVGSISRLAADVLPDLR